MYIKESLFFSLLIIFLTSCGSDSASNSESDTTYTSQALLGPVVDADDDGQLDETPTQVTGRFHTLLTGDQLVSGEAKATVLTEAAYQNVRYLLATKSSQENIIKALDRSTQYLLKQDLNNDGSIDHLDLSVWHPRLDRESTKLSLEQLELLVQDIHQNLSTAQHAVKLFDAIEPSLGECSECGTLCGSSAIESACNQLSATRYRD